jgi:hypothetical protein
MGSLGRMFVVLGLLSVVCVKAQTTTGKSWKIAVFTPVYLDSVFMEDVYALGKNNFPRYVLPGLDFYNGVLLAIDSLNAEKVAIEVLVYDTKSTRLSIEQQLNSEEMQDVSLIIASFNTRTEIKPLADFALAKKIPLISSTYPNDGGITANPFFILLNPTLITHIEAVYTYARRSYPTDNIIMFRRQGDVGDLIQSVFNEMNQRTPGSKLKFKMVQLTDAFSTGEVISHLDSNKQRNIVICASINETFGSNLSKALSSHKNYRPIAIGMPTWDGIRNISKDLEIVYSNPYYPGRADKTSLRLTDKYRNKYHARPGDMVFKGFESMYRFTKLLIKYGDSLIHHLSDKEYKLFTDFDIRPVSLEKENKRTDYLENKKLYFIRKKDGFIRSVN